MIAVQYGASTGVAKAAHRLVAVEGVIGVGKTTLVHRLAAALRARTVLEVVEENPFLPRFYADRRTHALSTQLFFLMSRFRQQEELVQQELFHAQTIADYIFDKDRIFADLTLEGHELALYDRLFEVLRPQVVTPDVVIYLRAEHEVVMKRIAARGRPYERDMDPAYIRALGQAYDRFFARFALCPVMTVETTTLDLRTDEVALRAILRAVRTRGGSRRLDPGPSGTQGSLV